jgi:prolyl oligopeptidase PreP (S9A serine peptidase family)
MFSKFAEKVGLHDFLAPVIKKRRPRKESEDETTTIATSFSDEQRLKRRRLDVQLKAEKEAAARGPKFFAKKQRVRYLNKTTNSVCDAVVVGVHLDDGPNNPYYTIKFKKQCEEILGDGSKKTTIIEVEKQTNPDRLSRVPWDEDAAWKVLQ